MRITILIAVLALAAVAAPAAFEGAARAQTPPASYYGAGLERGDVVTASIGGTECGSDTVDGSGTWAIFVYAGDCGGKASTGATVAFAVNGAPAEQTEAWRPGGTPDDTTNGITLTLAPVRPSAEFRGGGIDEGVVVAASIGGAACGESAAGADGRWSIAVREGDCGAAAGAVVSFTLDGREATPTATWEPGGDENIALTAVRPSAAFRGGGIDAGVVVAASIGGAACGESAAGADGRWSIAVREGDCGAAAGAVVSFTLDGREATPTATWEPGGDESIALTAVAPPPASGGLPLRLNEARSVYVQGEDGTFLSYVVGAPDFVNAAFAGRWLAASGAGGTPPGLTLGTEGALAVYMQDEGGAFYVYVFGAPDFVNAAFIERWSGPVRDAPTG